MMASFRVSVMSYLECDRAALIACGILCRSCRCSGLSLKCDNVTLFGRHAGSVYRET